MLVSLCIHNFNLSQVKFIKLCYIAFKNNETLKWFTIWSTLQAHITKYACTATVWGDGITLSKT